MRYLLFLVFFLFCFVLTAQESLAQSRTIRYVALGDSYTIGTGATPEDSWPAVLVSRLREKNIPIQLIANLGRAGWTSQNVIDHQLPVCKKLHPDFVTLLIGVNDWVQGVSEETFRKNIKTLMDDIVTTIPAPNSLVVLTIPDFSLTPQGLLYSGGRNISQGLAHFNTIIEEEARQRHLPVIDIYTFSQKLGNDPSLVAADGLHPSAKAYALWADFILPQVERLFSF